MIIINTGLFIIVLNKMLNFTLVKLILNKSADNGFEVFATYQGCNFIQ